MDTSDAPTDSDPIITDYRVSLSDDLKNPLPLATCLPLPEDVASLDDNESACQYCGVSYLLLHKYNNMIRHVNSMREIVNQHPGLVKSVESFTVEVAALKEEVERLLKEVDDAKGESGKAKRGMHEIQLRHTRLTHEMV